MNYVKRMSKYLSTVNFESMKKVSSCLHNSCIFVLYFDYIRNSLHVTQIFAEPQISLIFDIFQYSLACKLNYISVFVLNFFIIFLELTIK